MIEDLVTVKRSKRAKRVALRLDPVERVINLVVPEKMPLHKAYYFAQNHEDWVKETLNKLPDVIPFSHGQKLTVFGDEITINVLQNPDKKRIKITVENEHLNIITYHDDYQNRIKTYLKKTAKAGLSDIASEKAALIEKHISSISVRDTKSRWGSCSADGAISFSWRLIFAPYDAIDYVVAHEVAHLQHMDHSKDFWNLCEKLCLNYSAGKNWMKQHGNELMRYGQ